MIEYVMPYKKFDSKAFLERLINFGQRCQKIVGQLPKTQYNLRYGDQLIRSSSSPGANYIEALESLGAKDFIHKLRICRKETKESAYWIRMIKFANPEVESIQSEMDSLIEEGGQVVGLLTSSIITLEKKTA